MKKEKQFLVMWEIDIFAETPREAAEKARTIQLDANSTATVFEVIESDSAHMHHIDLLEEEDNA